jgi:dihydropteroate synthase
MMGVINVTPDSFSDGGDVPDVGTALAAARRMVADGAAIIDIGGESTRPGAAEVDEATELGRVMSPLEAIVEAKIEVALSIDTLKPGVARRAIAAGAEILNDVTGLQGEPEMAEAAAEAGVGVVAMHWDKSRDRSKDVVGEIKRWLEATARIAEKAGVKKERLVLDPGFGFAKDFSENYTILRRLDELAALGFPLLVGMSRKSMLGKLLGIPPKERGAATVATSVIAWQKGAHIFRVHEVRENLEAIKVAMATEDGPPPPVES